MSNLNHFNQSRFLRTVVARHRLLSRTAAGVRLLRTLGLAAAMPVPISSLSFELPRGPEADEPELGAEFTGDVQQAPEIQLPETTGDGAETTAWPPDSAPDAQPFPAQPPLEGRPEAPARTSVARPKHPAAARLEAPNQVAQAVESAPVQARSTAQGARDALSVASAPDAPPANQEEAQAPRSRQAPPLPPIDRRSGPAAPGLPSVTPSSLERAEAPAPLRPLHGAQRQPDERQPATQSVAPVAPQPQLPPDERQPLPINSRSAAVVEPPTTQDEITRMAAAWLAGLRAESSSNEPPTSLAAPEPATGAAQLPASVPALVTASPRPVGQQRIDEPVPSGGPATPSVVDVQPATRYATRGAPGTAAPSPTPRAEPSEPFSSTESGRSPQAWMERLFPHLRAARAVQPEEPKSPQRAAALPEPTPIEEPARALIQPLVGLDSTQVRIYRGSEAARVVEAHGADALAVGDAILLSADDPPTSPTTLGLIAHELTHVVRRREPRFVPPVAARSLRATPADEEALARLVEAEVQQAARASAPIIGAAPPLPAPAPQHSSPGPLPLTDEAPLGPHPQLPRAGMGAEQSVQPTPAAPAEPASDSPWGDLPAPWEPLPVWVAPAIDAPPIASVGPPLTAETASTEAPIQLAESDRSLPAVAAPAAPPPPEPAPAAPAPDLDELAQQVYSRLRRRLAAERRREG